MLYTTLTVVMAPFAAVLLDTVGVPRLLLAEGACAAVAALIESFVHVQEREREHEEAYTLRSWAHDLRDTVRYLSQEDGLKAMFAYMSVSNGLYMGYEPILIAFFRTAPGMSAGLYAFFSAAEFVGRTLGSMVQYRVKIPPERRFPFTFAVYQVYDLMDACLLWLPYPLMLANRTLCGFLGGNSSIMREAAMQRYIPERMRSRVNAFSGIYIAAACFVFSLLVGALGELLDYCVCVTICGVTGIVACLFFVWHRRDDVRKVYETAE
jgi:MFS family permease